MNFSGLDQLIIKSFSTLRRNGIGVGISELFAALKVLENAKSGLDEESLAEVQGDIRLLWYSGSNWQVLDEFDNLWENSIPAFLVAASDNESETFEPLDQILVPEVLVVECAQKIVSEQQGIPELIQPQKPMKAEMLEEVESSHSTKDAEIEKVPSPNVKPPPELEEQPPPQPINQNSSRKRGGRISAEPPPVFKAVSNMPSLAPRLNSLPVLTPFHSESPDSSTEVHSYFPISRLFMAYGWRYLRRLQPDGPADDLDVEATVERVAKQGFFLKPIYRRRQSNHAHLLLLIDKGGSMTPFDQIIDDLIETAKEESAIKEVDTFYFHNFLTNIAYADSYLINSVELDRILDCCDLNTSILIVSDAGSARGFINPDRIRFTLEMIFRLKQQTNLLAWLNPMPSPRWSNTSAKFIAEFIPMFQMDADGFSIAIDTLRGQSLRFF